MQKKKLKLGILFYFSEQWMGGVIYILNIIKILNALEEDEKPEILLFYRPGLKKFVSEIDYKYLTSVEWSFPSLIKGYLKSFLIQKNIFIQGILNNYSLDALFPVHDFPVRTKTSVKVVSWWADLQNKYYPEFFTWLQLVSRNIRTKLIIRNCDNLVLSSHDVEKDFSKFYKIRNGLNIKIFHFVSVINGFTEANFEDLKAKYKLPHKYFLVSNQFHNHKNHRVILLAIAKLKKMDIRINFAFTGKFPAMPDSPYLIELKRIIDENELLDQVTMLGLIPRNDQLQIMKHAQAVFQPSLFEGWSTVIEDAISLQVPVVASYLSVNIEQLGDKATYFNPHDVDGLAAIIKDYPERNLNNIYYEDYQVRIKEAARNFVSLFQ